MNGYADSDEISKVGTILLGPNLPICDYYVQTSIWETEILKMFRFEIADTMTNFSFLLLKKTTIIKARSLNSVISLFRVCAVKNRKYYYDKCCKRLKKAKLCN